MEKNIKLNKFLFENNNFLCLSEYYIQFVKKKVYLSRFETKNWLKYYMTYILYVNKQSKYFENMIT